MRTLIVTDRMLGSLTAKLRGHRMCKPLHDLGVENWLVDIRDGLEQAIHLAAKCDCVYTLKVDNWELYRELISRGIPYIFDLTDMLWSGTHQACGFKQLKPILEGAAVVTCDNSAMMHWASVETNAEVCYVPSALYVEECRAHRGCHRDIEVGWVGTPGTNRGVRRLQEWGLDIQCLGDTRSDYTEEELISFLSRVQVGVCPVPLDLDDYVYRGPGKVILYMAAGAVPVAVEAGDCRMLVDESKCGLLCRPDADAARWKNAITYAQLQATAFQIDGWDYVDREHTREVVAGHLKHALEMAVI